MVYNPKVPMDDFIAALQPHTDRARNATRDTAADVLSATQRDHTARQYPPACAMAIVLDSILAAVAELGHEHHLSLDGGLRALATHWANASGSSVTLTSVSTVTPAPAARRLDG